MATSTTKLYSPTLYKPGGTCTAIHGKYNGAVLQQIVDDSGLGRWSGFLLQRKHNKKIAIITAYRTCKQDILNVGVKTAYHQQYTMLNPDSTTNLDPRQIFIDDLSAVIIKYREEKISTILLIDANEQIGDTTNGISKLCLSCNLLDPISQMHGNNPKMNSCIQGSKQID